MQFFCQQSDLHKVHRDMILVYQMSHPHVHTFELLNQV